MAEGYGDSGALFRNDKKSTEKHPDYTGQATVAGTEFWLSAWIKQAKKSGKTYMSLAFTPKEAQGEEESQEEAVAVGGGDVPF